MKKTKAKKKPKVTIFTKPEVKCEIRANGKIVYKYGLGELLATLIAMVNELSELKHIQYKILLDPLAGKHTVVMDPE
jgi:hypothetical protein